MTAPKITTRYYIASGKLNAMYTLRRETFGGVVCVDSYICNLSTDPDKAETKAREYFDRVSARITNTESYEQIFSGYADFELGKRSGKLSIVDTERLLVIESGRFPFGKHNGKAFSDVPASYVLFFADMAGKTDNTAIIEALSAACLGFALDHDYIAARDEKRAQKRAEELKSGWIGEVGKRFTFEGVIIFSYEKNDTYNGTFYHITKIRQGQDIITYIGKKLGEVDELIKFKATIKKHDAYQDVKTTLVNRPAFVS